MSLPLVSPQPYILHIVPSGMEHPATGSWIVWTLSAGSAGLVDIKEYRKQYRISTTSKHTIIHQCNSENTFKVLTWTVLLGLNWSLLGHISHERCWLPASETSQKHPLEYLRLQATPDTHWGLEHCTSTRQEVILNKLFPLLFRSTDSDWAEVQGQLGNKAWIKRKNISTKNINLTFNTLRV